MTSTGDVTLRRTRTGTVALVHLPAGVDARRRAERAAEEALLAHPRWVVMGIAPGATADEVRAAAEAAEGRLSAHGVRFALVGDAPSSARGPGSGAFRVFPTLPVALGTLGVV